MNKKPAFNYRREREALLQEYLPLVERAGIAKDVERCERRLEPDYLEDEHLPPLFTDARREAQKQLDNLKFESYRYCQRKLIFGVQDESLRCQLIAMERKFHALSVEVSQQNLWAAQERRQSIDDGARTALYAAFGSGAIVPGLWLRGSTAHGVAASMLALVYATYDARYRDRQIRRKTNDLAKEMAELESTLNDEVRREVFTRNEEITGCADDGSTEMNRAATGQE